jgi:hypothetical protein
MSDMMKQIIPYILWAVCLLSACQTDDYEPTAGTTGESKMLSLTVSANDFAVTGGASTRAADNGKTTTFENGDRVGLIVLDESGNLVADNLPYKFNGSNWNFDTGNGEGKQPAFYDPSLNTYIVYYPYDAAANQTTSVDALKALNVFAPQEDQSTENAYRQSDLMVWSSSGKPMKQITAALAHVRNSFSLDAKVQWTLATGDMVSYTPPTLEDVIIYDKEGTQLSPYRAEDGSYRYILPDGYEGKVRWCYTYEEKTFGGECTVSSQATGTRYAQVETVNAGEYSLDKAAPGDFYCSKESNGTNTGYVLPQDAVAVLEQHRCIGIVFHVGKHETDQSDYLQPLTDDGPTIPDGKVHGYVVALTDVHNGSSDRLRWEYGPGEVYNEVVDASTSTSDWQGYSNSLKFHEFVNKNENKEAGWEMKHFPAALACETYGNRTTDRDGNPADGKYDWQKPLAAPKNTSGWFLPSCGQLRYLYQNRSVLSARMTDVKNSTPTDCGYKEYIKWFSTSLYYWSSSEYSGYPGHAWYVRFYDGLADYYDKNFTRDVRAVLAF